MKLILQAIKSLLNKINTRLAKLEEQATPADWDASDGEPGHVLNRTHYVIPGGTVLVPETEFTFDDDQKAWTAAVPLVTLETGRSYAVKFNGVEYICETEIVDLPAAGTTMLGNAKIIGGEESGEPFAFIALDTATAAQLGMTVAVMLADDGGGSSVVLSVTTEDHYVPLRPEYIPDLPHPSDILWIDAVTDSFSEPTTVAWKSGPELLEAQAAIQEGKDVKIRLTAGTETTVMFTVEKVTVGSIDFRGRENDDSPWMTIRFYLDTAMSIAKDPAVSGVILKSQDGSRYRLYVGNDGTLHTTLVE